MIEPVTHMTGSPDAYQKGYQQALDNFGVSSLLDRLSNFSDSDFDAHWPHWQEKELESLAAVLIGQLTAHLKGSLVADSLNLIRHRDRKVISSLPLIDFHLPQSIELPADRSIPLFWVGERKRHLAENGTSYDL